MQGDTLGKRAMRILMVEDDRRLASQIQKGLEEQRHTVTLAFDGREGLAAARQGQFDVVVLDVMLPGMDGFSIVKQVRADRIGTPILLLTARDSTEDVVTGLDAGVFPFGPGAAANQPFQRAPQRASTLWTIPSGMVTGSG